LIALLPKFHDSVIQSIYNNFDRQFYYEIANPRPLAGSASKYLRSLQAFALGQLWVRSVSALGSLYVRSGSTLANPEGTQSESAGSALGSLSVRLRAVGTEHLNGMCGLQYSNIIYIYSKHSFESILSKLNHLFQ
jgi:hypothetical protein